MPLYSSELNKNLLSVEAFRSLIEMLTNQGVRADPGGTEAPFVECPYVDTDPLITYLWV